MADAVIDSQVRRESKADPNEAQETQNIAGFFLEMSAYMCSETHEPIWLLNIYSCHQTLRCVSTALA